MNTSQYLGEIVIFNTENGEVKVQIDAVNETIWMNQKGMADLFGTNTSGISRHIKNIIDSGELDESNLQKMQIANSDKPVIFYSPMKKLKKDFGKRS